MSQTTFELVEVLVASTALFALFVQGLLLWKRSRRQGALMISAAMVVTTLVVPVVRNLVGTLVDANLLARTIVVAFLWGTIATVGLVVLLRNKPVMCAGLVVVVLSATLAAEWVAVPQWNVSRSIFVKGPVANPSSALRVSSKPSRLARFNVLLLGGDAGPGRWGLRTDAMHLVSLNASMEPDDGVVIISIPRNLLNAPMPATLRDKFPNGFNLIANALFGWGEQHSADVQRALGATGEPGASLVAAMVAEFTGLRVDGWILTDMRGFINLVDAAGGVDVWVDKHIRAPGSAFGALTPAHDFASGWQTLDGAEALSFTRARKQDSDYHRMARQRCVLASLAAQMSPGKLLARWPRIASTVAAHVRTNLSPAEIVQLRRMAGLQSRDMKVLSLVPPYVNTGLWDLEEVHTLVRNAIYGTRNSVVLPGTNTTVTAGDTLLAEDARWQCRVTKTG